VINIGVKKLVFSILLKIAKINFCTPINTPFCGQAGVISSIVGGGIVIKTRSGDFHHRRKMFGAMKAPLRVAEGSSLCENKQQNHVKVETSAPKKCSGEL
jgi:hypothetical protein